LATDYWQGHSSEAVNLTWQHTGSHGHAYNEIGRPTSSDKLPSLVLQLLTTATEEKSFIKMKNTLLRLLKQATIQANIIHYCNVALHQAITQVDWKTK